VRVGILSQWYDPEPGGPALPGVLARGLTTRGHDVQVITGFPNYPQGRIYDGYRMRRRRDEDIDGVAVRRVALYPAHGQRASRRFLNFTSFAASASVSGIGALRDVDVFWVYNSPATISAPARLAKLLMGKPHVLHVMDLWPDSITAAGFDAAVERKGPATTALDAWCRASYRWASSVAYITPGVGRVLRQRGVPAEKLRYIPVWADEEVFSPSHDDRLRVKLGLEGKTVLLYAGALGAIQGLDTLLAACDRVRDVEDFHCVIAGGGAEEAALRAEAARLQLSNVTFLGQIAKPEMTEVMALGDVHLVSLSRHPLSEITLPSKIQATLASGRPALVAVDGDAAAVAEQSGAGIPVTPGDPQAMERAIRHVCSLGRGALAQMGERGRTYYEENFALEIALDRIEEALVTAAEKRQD
jgi:colanic acid biosynthesis glycosyl transferase WcaI